jgi:hypothetical protein
VCGRGRGADRDDPCHQEAAGDYISFAALVLDAELDALHDGRLKSIFKEVLNKLDERLALLLNRWASSFAGALQHSTG